MATALVHITTAMQHLAKLAAGGTPSSAEQTLGLLLLNNMLSNWQAEGIGGFSTAESVSGKSMTVATSTNTITTTDVGGTKTITLTKTAIATFASTGTDNTYPTGWDEAIQYNLAVTMSGSLGVMIDKMPALLAKAQQTKQAITPPIPGGAA
jgi:hypothetical protein